MEAEIFCFEDEVDQMGVDDRDLDLALSAIGPDVRFACDRFTSPVYGPQAYFKFTGAQPMAMDLIARLQKRGLVIKHWNFVQK
jgi:hypothetical protein